MDRFLQTLVSDRLRTAVHSLGDRIPGVLAYRGRVLARPSVARVVDEARPYRKLFPQGAPDRD
jgi:glutathione S-transferase